MSRPTQTWPGEKKKVSRVPACLKWGQASHYTYRKGHAKYEGDGPSGAVGGKEARPQVMSRIDYALCSEGLLKWVKGIGLDTVQRLQGMDHRFLMVDLKPEYFASDNSNSGIWLPEEPEYPTVPRIRLDNWGKEERREFRKTLQDMMEEAKSVKPETTKPADLVYVGGKDRKYKDGAKGEWWEATRDPKRAMRWALASCQGNHSVTIRALQLDSQGCKLNGQLRLDTTLRNQKMGIKGSLATKHVAQGLVLLGGEPSKTKACKVLTVDQGKIAELTTEGVQYGLAAQALDNWANGLEAKHSTDIPYHDQEFHRINTLLRQAAEATLPQPQPKIGRGGRPVDSSPIALRG